MKKIKKHRLRKCCWDLKVRKDNSGWDALSQGPMGKNLLIREEGKGIGRRGREGWTGARLGLTCVSGQWAEPLGWSWAYGDVFKWERWMLFWWGSVIKSKELECALQYRAPCSDFTQDLTCEAGGREGKVCVFKNNMLFLYFVAEGPAGCWEGPAPQPGASGAVQLSFHTAFVPSPWLPPQGRTSVGTVPVSLPLQPLPSWMWYDCFSGHSEKMPVENGSISCLSNFFKAK